MGNYFVCVCTDWCTWAIVVCVCVLYFLYRSSTSSGGEKRGQCSAGALNVRLTLRLLSLARKVYVGNYFVCVCVLVYLGNYCVCVCVLGWCSWANPSWLLSSMLSCYFGCVCACVSKGVGVRMWVCICFTLFFFVRQRSHVYTL